MRCAGCINVPEHVSSCLHRLHLRTRHHNGYGLVSSSQPFSPSPLPMSRKHSDAPDADFSVGRTGTDSLRIALDVLGQGPTYHIVSQQWSTRN